MILAMCLFALSMSVSPGPVNLVTFSSGMNFGFLPSLPFVAGAAIGFTLLLVVVGLGLGEIVALSPKLMQAMAYAGTVQAGTTHFIKISGDDIDGEGLHLVDVDLLPIEAIPLGPTGTLVRYLPGIFQVPVE